MIVPRDLTNTIIHSYYSYVLTNPYREFWFPFLHMSKFCYLKNQYSNFTLVRNSLHFRSHYYFCMIALASQLSLQFCDSNSQPQQKKLQPTQISGAVRWAQPPKPVAEAIWRHANIIMRKKFTGQGVATRDGGRGRSLASLQSRNSDQKTKWRNPASLG